MCAKTPKGKTCPMHASAVMFSRALKGSFTFTHFEAGFTFSHVRSNISNTRESVSLGYPNTKKRVENTTRSGVFLTKFESGADKTLS